MSTEGRVGPGEEAGEGWTTGQEDGSRQGRGQNLEGGGRGKKKKFGLVYSGRGGGRNTRGGLKEREMERKEFTREGREVCEGFAKADRKGEGGVL